MATTLVRSAMSTVSCRILSSSVRHEITNSTTAGARIRGGYSSFKRFYSEDTPTTPSINKSEKLPGSMSGKYVPFEDEKRIILDVNEEQWHPVEQEFERTEALRFKRGRTGMIDLPDLIQLLKEENAMDICAIRIPPEMYYADYMVIVTTRSARHLFSLATFVRKRLKLTQLKSTDRLPKIEGTKNSADWIAIDLGNIILHIFSEQTRELYNLETLWTVGWKFDDLSHSEDSDIVQLLNMFK